MRDFISFYEEAQSRPLFFILGAQGSGTNLTCNIFKKIFNFSIVRDQSLIFNTALKIHRNQSTNSINGEFENVFSKFFPGHIGKRLQLKHYHHRTKYYMGIEKFFDKIKIENAEDFAYFFYTYHAFSENKDYVAIKSDDLWENLRYMSRIFSNYKLIFLTRDCRDNVLSIRKKNFGPKSVYFASQYIKQRISSYHNEVLKHPDLSLQVQYEELLTNPKDFIKRFSMITGIDPLDDIDKRLEELKIRKTNFRKWKTTFSKRELLMSETVLQNELNALGYGTENQTFQKISNAQILRERIYDVAFRIPQKVKRVYWNLIRG